jgi:hypothetical protein
MVIQMSLCTICFSYARLLIDYGREVKKYLGVMIPNLHPCSWATDVLHADVCSPAMAAMLICGAWTLWAGWNARRHGRKVQELGATTRYISSMLEELALLKMPTQPAQPRCVVQWKRAEDG